MSPRATIITEPDTNPALPNKIELYVHCHACLDQMPPGVSPHEWTQLAVGFQTDGTLQVVCKRCEQNVLVLNVNLVQQGD